MPATLFALAYFSRFPPSLTRLLWLNPVTSFSPPPPLSVPLDSLSSCFHYSLRLLLQLYSNDGSPLFRFLSSSTIPPRRSRFANPGGSVYVKVTAWNKLGSAVSGRVILRLLDGVEKVTVEGPKTTYGRNETQFRLQFWRGTDVSCRWDFGDGSAAFFPSCQSGDVVAHQYQRCRANGATFGVDVCVSVSVGS